MTELVISIDAYANEKVLRALDALKLDAIQVDKVATEIEDRECICSPYEYDLWLEANPNWR
jgi:hypothetical protein